MINKRLSLGGYAQPQIVAKKLLMEFYDNEQKFKYFFFNNSSSPNSSKIVYHS